MTELVMGTEKTKEMLAENYDRAAGRSLIPPHFS